jgi:multiple sugar transport system substrate-binding protein
LLSKRPFKSGAAPLAALCALLLAGCPQRQSTPAAKPPSKPLAGVTLRLLVIDDPALAAAANVLGGEWSAQTGSKLEVIPLAAAELLKDDPPAADAVIGPPRLLGELVQRKLVVPLPDPKTLQQDRTANWFGIFRGLRQQEAGVGGELTAIPFGSPVLVCYYRPDLLKKLRRHPPRTWEEYHALAALLADRSALGELAPTADRPWFGALEPLGPGWAGLTLLARAAPYAKHRGNYSTLFNIQTMEPLVDGPPFVRALEELAAAAQAAGPLAAEVMLACDPAAVREAFWRGECGLAITWPTAAATETATSSAPLGRLPGNQPTDHAPELSVDQSADPPASRPAVQSAAWSAALPDGGPTARVVAGSFADLPGSPMVFDVVSRGWQKREPDEEQRVTLLSISGRIGLVSARSARPTAALELLVWLSSDQMSAQFCPQSPATTLFRRSHLKAPRLWVEPTVPAEAAEKYAEIVRTALEREQCFAAPTLPGAGEYLAALDAAVAQTIRGEQPAIEALRQAARKWQKITQDRDVATQRTAYRRSLGLW